MQALARFAMRSPVNAAGMTAVCTLLALVLPPLLVLSGALVGLATLSQGSREGLRVIVFASLICGAVLYLLFDNVAPVVGYVATVWAPLWAASLVLRRSRKQGVAVLFGGAIVGLYALIFRLVTDDVAGWWRERLEPFLQALGQQGGARLGTDEITLIAQMMQPAALVVFSVFLFVTLFLARWWQAALYNPGGFGSEFRLLTLPRLISPLAAVVALGLLLQLAGGGAGGFASDLMIILVVLFALQGLAIVHHRVDKMRLSVGWLTGLYVLLMLLPHFVGTGLAVVGIGDTFADFRGCRRQTPSI